MLRAVVMLLAAVEVSTAAAVFRFETGEFWLNLHHFLYVLGRAQAKAPDRVRAAVAGAPAEAEEGLKGRSEAEREAWSAAVDAYAKGLSRKDLVFDEAAVTATRAIAAAKDAAALPSEARAALESAAPVYRAVWWARHREQNEAWVRQTEPLLARYGNGVLQFITKAYGFPWPAAGYPVHVSAYSNWAGAYSTSGDLLVIASNGKSGTHGLDGLEIAFHEAMHQWDDAMAALIDKAAAGRPAPRNLSHALIFYTAGEAVRRVAPEHVPYAEAYGIWQRGWTSLKAVLDRAWKPYLDGHGSRDEALAAVVATAGQ